MATDTVNWTNVHYSEPVTLEIRRGNRPNPTDNPIVSTPAIGPGQTHTEQSDAQDFFWLRKDPDPESTYTQVTCFGSGETKNIDV